MEEFIRQLKKLLENIEQEMPTSSDAENNNEKELQLQSVEKTIHKLSNSNVSIPSEYRDLKFRLINEIDQYNKKVNSLEEIKNIIYQWLQKNQLADRSLFSKKASSRGTRAAPQTIGVKIIDLINAGIISVGDKLFKNYKGEYFEATIIEDGKVQTYLNNNVETFNSPSLAAINYIGKTRNGWTFWRINKDGVERKLDYYRQEFVASQKNEN